MKKSLGFNPRLFFIIMNPTLLLDRNPDDVHRIGRYIEEDVIVVSSLDGCIDRNDITWI